METGYIRFSDTNRLEISLANNTVWMTANEIADLFGVNIPTVNKQLKELFKTDFLSEREVSKEYRYTCPKHRECIRIYYNLELITFLSFRIQSFYAKLFREWVFSTIHKEDSKDKIYNAFVMCNLGANEYSQLSLN